MNKENASKLWKIIQEAGDYLKGQLPDHPNHPKGRNPYAHVAICVKSKFNASYKDIEDEKFDEVVNYIAYESKTNIRDLIGILNRVIAFSRVHNKVLTTTDCKNILKDVFSQIKVITVDKIQNVVSNFFNIPLSEMLSQRRSRPLARPRQIAMFLAKKMTSRSLPEIGRRFANRDHTTVIHAVKTITRLSEQDDEMKKNINQIKSILLEQ